MCTLEILGEVIKRYIRVDFIVYISTPTLQVAFLVDNTTRESFIKVTKHVFGWCHSWRIKLSNTRDSIVPHKNPCTNMMHQTSIDTCVWYISFNHITYLHNSICNRKSWHSIDDFILSLFGNVGCRKSLTDVPFDQHLGDRCWQMALYLLTSAQTSFGIAFTKGWANGRWSNMKAFDWDAGY